MVSFTLPVKSPLVCVKKAGWALQLGWSLSCPYRESNLPVFIRRGIRLTDMPVKCIKIKTYRTVLLPIAGSLLSSAETATVSLGSAFEVVIGRKIPAACMQRKQRK